MKPRYIQVNCTEGDRIDLRQSRAVLKYKPDFIFLEYAKKSSRPITKPRYVSKDVISKYPWTESDNIMWANIVQLWKSGHTTLVYAIDGPDDLVKGANTYPYNKKYPHKTTNLFWWVRIYLRECFMARNIENVLKHYQSKKDPTILIFLQSFHWRHVRFLLSKPSKRAIGDYYFKRFSKLTHEDIFRLVHNENKILFKYWNNPINFCK